MSGKVIAAGLCISLAAVQARSEPLNPANDMAVRMAGFGFDVLKQLSAARQGKNVFISPVSLSLALTMTWNGSAGATRTAMSKTLGLKGIKAADVNRAAARLTAELAKADPKIQISIANSLWARKGISFLPAFINANKKYFRADVREIEFGPEAPGMINAWVKDRTKGKIAKIIDRIPANALLYLINAVHFKGPWQSPFDKSRTSDGFFKLADGTEISVPMMIRQGSYGYKRAEGFQAVSIPYGGGRICMFIMLPDKPSGLPELLQKLDAGSWAGWTSGLKPTEVNLSLPRFRIEYGVEEELKKALTAAGMKSAFDPNKADFSRMCRLAGERVFISQVAHKTFIDVNEAGTEAAAATSVEMSFTAAPMEPVRVAVDRPFLCAIRDTVTGAVLFIGAVANPKA